MRGCLASGPLCHRDDPRRILAEPHPRADESDDRPAKIAHLQGCYDQDHGQQNGPEAVIVRRTDAKTGRRASNDGRDKDENLKAQAEHSAGEHGRHREHRDH
jgi:hypothetical protein